MSGHFWLGQFSSHFYCISRVCSGYIQLGQVRSVYTWWQVISC